MKKRYILLLFVSNFLLAQNVGIGTSTPKATLDINSAKLSNKADGVILPSISLSELTIKGDNLYTQDHKGVVLFINDVNGGNTLGQRANINAIGYYYYDGALWRKLQMDKSFYTASGDLISNRTINLDGKTLAFTNNSGNDTVNQFSIDGNTVNMHTINNQVGIGNSQAKTRLDIRTDTNNSSDPGYGMLGIGTTNTMANEAGAGAMRYNFTNGGMLQYSNGVVWNNLESEIEKAVVIAYKASTQNIQSGVETTIIDWFEDVDNSNSYDPLTGVFTAPKTGSYIVSYSVLLSQSQSNMPSNTYVEIKVKSSSNVENTLKSRNTFPKSGNSHIGSYLTEVVHLTKGEQISGAVFQNSGMSKSLRANIGFVNFSVVEL